MRFEHFSDQQLDESVDLMEVNMSPGALKQFSNSPEAKDIKAGFEAEMIFPGMGGGDDDDADYPEVDDESVSDIADAVRFFSEGNSYSGNGLYGRQQDKFQEWLQELYYEWLSEQVSSAWDDDGRSFFEDWMLENEFSDDWKAEKLEEFIEEEIDDTDDLEKVMDQYRSGDIDKKYEDLVKHALARVIEARDEAIEEAWDDQDRNYEQAYEEFRDGKESEFSESDWFDAEYPYMSDVYRLANRSNSPVDLYWPDDEPEYSGPSGGYDYDNAQELARSLRRSLDVNARANSDYHEGRPENTWILEPDGSLQADDDEDMPVEIISPPMPLEECLTKIDQFFAWAADHDAYTNSTTGFHVGVSLPYIGGDVDYIKLALFLGDQFVLDKFQRSTNTYCKSALKVIKEHVAQGKAKPEDVMHLMRNNLLELAHRSIRTTTNKYESINMKGGKYIEFRSMGNEGYNESPDVLKDIIRRYAYAMYLAGNPAAERKEYYKKLYKLVSPEHSDILNLFAAYSSGEIDSTQLKERWSSVVAADFGPIEGEEAAAAQQTQRQKVAKKIQSNLPMSFWYVTSGGRTRYNPGGTVVLAASQRQAIDNFVRQNKVDLKDNWVEARPTKKFSALFDTEGAKPYIFFADNLQAAERQAMRAYGEPNLNKLEIKELGPDSGLETT